MNWFKYRLPNLSDIVCGASESLIEGLGRGFVIAPFLNPSENILTIPFDFIPEDSEIKPIPSSLPDTTPHDEYLAEIKAIKEDLQGKRGKTVAARIINLNCKIDINETFAALCEAYPDAFVFAFSSSVSGTWIGASPELLLKKKGEKVFSMALAGTRESSHDSNLVAWDEKNQDEQMMVVEFVRECLEKTCTGVKIYDSFTKNAGCIEHICTPLEATLREDDDKTLKELVCRLSPTPAVCGNDRNHSLSLIGNYEKFEREYYGGFCGPNNLKGASAFYVILRCAKLSDKSCSIFVGGGITPLSDAHQEWKETELKSKTIINKLKTLEE